MLLWDGFSEVVAVCYEHGTGISPVKTPIGSKLLLNNALVRRGAVLLTKKCCSYLGGNNVAEYRSLTYQHRLKVKLGLATGDEAPGDIATRESPQSSSASAEMERIVPDTSVSATMQNSMPSIGGTSSSAVLEPTADNEQYYHHPHIDFFDDVDYNDDAAEFDDDFDYESLEKEAVLKHTTTGNSPIVIDDDDD